MDEEDEHFFKCKPPERTKQKYTDWTVSMETVRTAKS